MQGKVCIAYDGSPSSQRALELGLDLAKSLGEPAVVLTVTEPPGFDTLPLPKAVAAYQEACDVRGGQLLQAAQDAARVRGVVVSGLHLKGRYPPEAIPHMAAEKGCTLIVIGGHGHHERLSLLGNVAEKVVLRASVPVLVVPSDA